MTDPADPAPPAKAKKAPKTPKPPKQPGVDTIIQGLFTRPYSRRMTYLYTGLDDTPTDSRQDPTDPDLYFLGTHSESDRLEYCDTDQAVGIVAVYDGALGNTVRQWLSGFGLDNRPPGILSLTTVTAALNKVKWDVARLAWRWHEDGYAILDDTVVWHPFTDAFVFHQLTSVARERAAAVFQRPGSVRVPLVTSAAAVAHAVRLDAADLSDDARALLGGSVRFILTRGLDLLVPVTDISTPDFEGLVFWSPSDDCVAFAHVCATPTHTLAATRIYSMLMRTPPVCRPSPR